MITLEQVIDDLRARGKRLPLALAGQLFCAAVRLVVKRPVSVRPQLLALDEQEGLVLVPPPEDPTGRDRPDRPGYVAPEVASGVARPDEPRALVYAAGALGYELLTGRTPPQPPRTAGAELSGPLAAVVRSALSVIRGERPPGLPALRAALETEEAPPPAEQEQAMLAALGARFNADAPSAPPAATSAPPAAPAETAPSPPDAEVKIASVQKQVHATREKLARLEDAVLKQAEEQDRMGQDLVEMRSEHDRTVASLGKREEKLLARLASLETAVRASQVEAFRRSPSWRPFAAAAGGGALVTLILVLALGGRTPAPQPSSHQEPMQPEPQAVEPAPQRAQPVPQAPQPAHASPPPAVPGLGAGPPQAAPGKVTGDRALAGAPTRSGGLTAEQVRKKLEENRGALRGCIDEALRRDPNLRLRKIHVATTIAPSGQVTAAEIDDRTVNQSPLGTCLKRATRRIVFPSFAGEPFDVDIPIVVSARDR